MRMTLTTAVTLAAFLTLAGQALAQKGGGGGVGGGGGGGRGGFGGGRGEGKGEDGPRINWQDSLESVLERVGALDAPPDEGGKDKKFRRAAGEKKAILVYVRPAGEVDDPNSFNNQDITLASYGPWVYVRINFDKDNALIRSLGLRAAPGIAGLDLYGNIYQRAQGTTADAVRAILKTVPELIARYEAKLESDFQKAMAALKSDTERGTKALVDLVSEAKPGYKEVAEAVAELRKLGEAALKNAEVAESVSPESGIQFLEGLIKLFKATPPGLLAEIRIARIEHARGNVSIAIQRLLKATRADARLYAPEIEVGSAFLKEISVEGSAKIDAALQGGRGAAREALKKIAKDYAGSEAGQRALDEMKKSG